MAAIEVGRVCTKTKGRDAGCRCVITKVIDKNNVMVISANRKKERKCSIKHVDPLPITVNPSNQSEMDSVFA